MDILDLILRRRSIRVFEERPVADEAIVTLLKAASAAPTAANCLPWEFIVVNASERLASLREELIFARYPAPLAIVVCGNLKLAFKGPEQELWVQDCSAAMENLLLAATGLDLGAVWIGVYPNAGKIRSVRRLLDIPEHVVPLGLAYVGHPGERKEARTRYDEKRVYWQAYDPDRKHRAKHAPTKGHY